MSNPLLETCELPPFSRIKPEHIQPAIKTLIKESEEALSALLTEQKTRFSWETLQQPLDDIADRLSQAWSPVSHMNSTVNSDALRESYNGCLPELSAYATRLGQNSDLYQAYLDLSQSSEFKALDTAQRKTITNSLRDFRLAGVALPEDKKQRYGEIKKRLSQITSQFSDNVLDATMAWSKLIDSPSELTGLPQSALDVARQLAKEKGHETGWLFNLDFPSYHPVMTYADNRQLREEFYTAYNTKASDQGPNAGEFDNSAIMIEILQLRHELAQLLDYDNYAECSLATKMAESTGAVITFLEDLAERSRPQAQRELDELKAFARQHGVAEIKAWDIGYLSEKLRHQRFSISQEELRPWFPAKKVIDGMFQVVGRLYDLTFEEVSDIDSWHSDVSFYNVSRRGEVVGRFYLDLYAREHKRGGAWMDECRVRRRTDEFLQLPVAYLTCNFTPPVGEKPSLLTHDEVVTLFHEFGHGLHHMLTQVDYAPVSGINGVAWDAVELPSQFMENWCWQAEGLELISGHFQTGKPLPKEKLDRLLAAKNFQSAMMMLRQLEFALFDFKLHQNYGDGLSVQQVLDKVRSEVAVIIPPSFNRFQHSFSHIFAGGYAAGYYSYKWAEVLSSDAFSRFEEEGIFNRKTGESFLKEILEKGGSEEPMELFKRFRGREPRVDALLRHSGID